MNLFKFLVNKQVSRHGLILIVVNASSTIMGFLSGAAIAAVIGPYGRGIYQEWRIFTSIFSDISSFGLGKFITSKFDIEATSFKGIRKHILLLFLFATALIPLMVHMHFTTSMILIFYLLVPIGVLFDVCNGLLIRNEKYTVVALLSLFVMSGGSLVTIVFFLVQKLTVDNVIIASSILSLLALLLGFRYIKVPKGSKSIYSNYKKIIPIYISNVSRTLFLYVDQILVLFILTVADLGIFAMAKAVASISIIATNPIYTLSTSIARRMQHKRVKVFLYLFAIYATLSILAILFCHYFLSEIVTKTIGNAFLPIVPIVPVLFLGNILFSFIQFFVSWSMYENQGKIILVEKCMHALGLFLSGAFVLFTKTIESVAWMSITTYIPSSIFFIILFLKQKKQNSQVNVPKHL